jgi:hypothetical protein
MARPDYSFLGSYSRCRDSGCSPVCRYSPADTVANPSSPWLRLIALLELGPWKPSALTETRDGARAQSRVIAVWSHLGIDVYYCCIECNCCEYYGADWCSGNSYFPVRNAACLYLVC